MTAEIGNVYAEIDIPHAFSFNVTAIIADEKWISKPRKISDEEISIEIDTNTLLKVYVSKA